MSRQYSILLLALVVLFGACGCEKPKPEEEPQQQEQTAAQAEGEKADLSLITQSVPVTNDWIWSSKPDITLHIENGNAAAVKVAVKVQFKTDKSELFETLTDSVEVPGKGATDYKATTKDALAPGFYRAVCAVNGKVARNFCFGIDPLKIISQPDMEADYESYWQGVKDQLKSIDMHANLIEIAGRSSASRKVYLVEFNSVPDGLSGEPVVVRGYYCEPQDGKKHPVIMHFFPYDTQGSQAMIDCPSGSSSEYAEFYLSHRGQYINNRPASSRLEDGLGDLENIYGDWFAYQFGDKDSYYYRGAFMDCVQAVRFMATRPTSDMNKLFAEGSSQGGALCYAAAALSEYPFTAIAPNVAFLGDFPNYFDIVGWPGSTAKTCAKKAGMTDEQMYRFLSYFDTKNLATHISCGVLATSGLQDGTCPPRTNVAPFNNLKTAASKKEYHCYPEMTHSFPPAWDAMVMEFFKKFL